jgi:hypothetical protein
MVDHELLQLPVIHVQSSLLPLLVLLLPFAAEQQQIMMQSINQLHN